MKSPILMFGMPRSGTTWIGKIFDSHPDTLYRHEPDSRQRLTSVPLFPRLQDESLYAGDIRSYVANIPRLRTLKTCGKYPLFAKSYCNKLCVQLTYFGILVARLGERVVRDFPVIGAPTGDDYQDARLVWKSIESLGRLGLILNVITDARGIHLLRHPCGHIASVLRGEARRRFDDTRPSSEDYGLLAQLVETEPARKRGITLDQLRSLEPVERLAWRWVLYNEKAMEDAKTSGRCTAIRYEDVCNAPELAVRQMFEAVGLEWSEQTAGFIGASTEKEKNNYYSIFKNPKQAAQRWKTELETRLIDKIYRVIEDSPVGRFYERE